MVENALKCEAKKPMLLVLGLNVRDKPTVSFCKQHVVIAQRATKAQRTQIREKISDAGRCAFHIQP
jgi:hypothetical protein